jgi:uncharacterized protein
MINPIDLIKVDAAYSGKVVPLMDLHLLILGFIVTTLIAITGVGGGSLMAPALILGFGIVPPVAVGTDLIYAAVTKAGAVRIYARQKRVR